MNIPRLSTLLFIFIIVSCSKKREKTLFSLLHNTHINFENNLKETKEFNVFTYRNFYNGGGVAIGDLNNDGLPDVFFTANQESNKLYVNKGNFQFEDVSAKAGFIEKKQWSTGVVLVDINNDGWLDIYVCNAGNMFDPALQKNQLFINNHNLTFTESAAQFKLDAEGYTTQASFFDYDMDGDLDCFMVNNSPIPVNTLNYANMRDSPAADWDVADFLKGGGDHLYRNDNGQFTEVTKEAGIHGSLISLGLGVTVGDVNGDAYPDVYVSNDFFERDYLYINQHDGTFKDELENRMQHTSLASMGADMQDVNNDGYTDIFTTDMLPEDDYRLKTTTSFDNYDVYRLKENSGFYHQFMQNTLQLNNTNGRFMEIANYSGVEASDWSWGGFMFDADNDGYNDLYICNGIAHDLTDQDFIDFFASVIMQKMVTSGKKDEMDSIINKMPSTPLKNKMFRNNGDLRFKDVGDQWGFTTPSFSNGAAYGDLDNDGDLDMIVNNVNGPAFVYRNNSIEQNKNNYIGFVLKGIGKNNFAIGTTVKVYAGTSVLSRELIPSRGFQSSMDYKLLIGLGILNKIDSVKIIWPNRSVSKIDSISINKVNEISQPLAAPLFEPKEEHVHPFFVQKKADFDKHEDDDYVDFYNERNIPMMLSKEGPKAAVADVNGDGMDDVYIGGANNKGGQLYIQTAAGKFVKRNEKVFKEYAGLEDVACLFFDCDGDGDKDLFVGAGGNNKIPNSFALQHRLYKNDGKGNFVADTTAFPANSSNVGPVDACDYDNDGDLDLFVGGRNASYLYGVAPASYIYVNNGKGQFSDMAATKNKDIAHIGMVTGAIWADIAGDKQKELVITGEWMAPKIFSFNGDHFQENRTNLDSLSGWWQTVTVADLDGDGRNDLLFGNTGENGYLRPSKTHPVKLYTSNFGMTGTPDKILSITEQGKDVPVFLKHNMEEQFPYLKKQNLRHVNYANKSIGELFDDEQVKRAVIKKFDYCSSIIAWNEGNGKFSVQPFPPYVQFSSVKAIHCTDINSDGKPDIVLGGNEFGFPPQFGRLDASYVSVLMNEGSRKFTLLNTRQSGIELTGQIRDIRQIEVNNKKCILFLRNEEYPALFELESPVGIKK